MLSTIWSAKIDPYKVVRVNWPTLKIHYSVSIRGGRSRFIPRAQGGGRWGRYDYNGGEGTITLLCKSYVSLE